MTPATKVPGRGEKETRRSSNGLLPKHLLTMKRK